MNKHIEEYYQNQMVKDAFNKFKSFPTNWRYENKVKLQDVGEYKFDLNAGIITDYEKEVRKTFLMT